MSEHVTDLNGKDFEEFINKNKKVVIDFHADWCAPCLMMAPVIEEISKKLKDIKFARIDVDSERELAQKFSIMSIPCFIVFKDGKELDRIIGGMHKTVFEERLRKIFQL